MAPAQIPVVYSIIEVQGLSIHLRDQQPLCGRSGMTETISMLCPKFLVYVEVVEGVFCLMVSNAALAHCNYSEGDNYLACTWAIIKVSGQQEICQAAQNAYCPPKSHCYIILLYTESLNVSLVEYTNGINILMFVVKAIIESMLIIKGCIRWLLDKLLITISTCINIFNRLPTG